MTGGMMIGLPRSREMPLMMRQMALLISYHFIFISAMLNIVTLDSLMRPSFGHASLYSGLLQEVDTEFSMHAIDCCQAFSLCTGV